MWERASSIDIPIIARENFTLRGKLKFCYRIIGKIDNYIAQKLVIIFGAPIIFLMTVHIADFFKKRHKIIDISNIVIAVVKQREKEKHIFLCHLHEKIVFSRQFVDMLSLCISCQQNLSKHTIKVNNLKSNVQITFK